MAYFNGKKVFNAAFTSLYDEGHQDGYEEGYQNGYNTGGSEGYRAGQQEGIPHTCQVLNEVLLADDMPSVSIPSSFPDGVMPPEPLQEAMEDVYLCAAARWDADTQQGETLTFQQCKGGRFSGTEEYGLRVVGKTAQEGTPTPTEPIPIQCVKAGTEILCRGNNLLDPSALDNPNIGSAGDGYSNISITRDGDVFTLNGTIENIGHSWRADYVYVPIRRNTRYTLSVHYISGTVVSVNGTWATVMTGKTNTKDTQYTNWLSAGLANEDTYASYTCGENDYLSHFWFYFDACGGSYTFDNYKIKVQVIEGDANGTYESYIGNSIVTPCDLYDGDIWYPQTGKVERHNKLRVLNGTEQGYQENDFYVVQDENTSLINTNVKSNAYVLSQPWGIPNSIYLRMNSAGYIIFDSTVSTWAEFLAVNKTRYDNGTPTIIVVGLQTPVIEQYDPQPLFAPAGTATVTQSATDLPATLSATLAVERG